MSQIFRNIIKDPLIALVALLSVFVHLVLVNNLEYHRDELLYFSLGMHPSAGYASVPPLIGWIAWFILISLPVLPIGIPVFRTSGLVDYFEVQEKKYGIDLGRRFEDGTIHSLPQDYADMLGWEELTSIADKAYRMIKDKDACFIYAENYGQAGAITIIGKKYGLPEAISFSESFKYWYPNWFDPDITSLVYINDKPGDDIKAIFSKITLIGSISNPHAHEYGTAVFLCEEPTRSFNKFWEERIRTPE